MRPFNAEMNLRKMQRQCYFEDPRYRKWSDIQQDSTLSLYEAEPDNDFFIDYLFGTCDNPPSSPIDIRRQMDKGKELPINWDALYAYFDERFNDPGNDYKHQFTYQGYYTAGFKDEVSLIEILEEYREILLQPMYDIV